MITTRMILMLAIAAPAASAIAAPAASAIAAPAASAIAAPAASAIAAPAASANAAPAASAIAAPPAPQVRSTADQPAIRMLDASATLRKILADYPAEAIRDGVEGKVGIALNIAPTGRVMGCRITGTSGSPMLDQAACQGMTRHARFVPRRDAAGRPVAADHQTTITYSMP